MPPMDSSASYYEGPWLLNNNSPELFDVKSEAASFSNPLLNSLSCGESCMSKVEQVVYQRASNLSSAPHLSSLGDVSTIISDSLLQNGLDPLKPVKCAFSTITSAQRANPCLDALVSSVPMDSQLSEPTCFPRKDGWSASGPSNPQPYTTGSFKSLGGGRLAKSGSSGGGSAASETTTKLQKESQITGRNNVKSRSDDTSLDDIITTSSGVSSTSGYLPMEQEDDDGVCTTSEPSSQMGRSLPLGVTAGVGAIALARKDEQQQQMSGLTGISRCSDQRGLGSSSSASPGAQTDQESILSNDSGCFPMSDGLALPSVVPVDVKPTQGDLGAIVDDGSWCKKESKEAVGSGAFLPVQILNHANASTTPVGASSFLRRSTSSNICYPQNDTRNLAALNATLNPVVADKSVATFREAMVRGSIMKDHLTHDMLFRAPFASVNLAEVENSRPKRRNVKISKDPQSVAARHRRERISDRIRILQRLVPGGTKMDTASMLDEAISYVKYLKAQVQTLETVNSATGSFDPRLNFGPSSLYRTSFSGLPYNQMAVDCSSVSQGIGSGPIDFKDMREGFPPLCDGNYAVQFCH